MHQSFVYDLCFASDLLEIRGCERERVLLLILLVFDCPQRPPLNYIKPLTRALARLLARTDPS